MRQENIYSLTVDEVMTPSPRSIDENISAAEALGIMELYQITHLVIIDDEKRLRGILHLHDILGKEEFRLNGGLTST
jgi:arabinose-5-phosphate isomerase